MAWANGMGKRYGKQHGKHDGMTIGMANGEKLFFILQDGEKNYFLPKIDGVSFIVKKKNLGNYSKWIDFGLKQYNLATFLES